MKKMSLTFLGLAFILINLFGCSKHENTYAEKIMRYVDNQVSSSSLVTVKLSDFTAFDWDKMVVFEPMTSKAEIEKELGFVFDAQIDVFGGILFFNQDKLVLFSEFKDTFDGNYLFKIIPHSAKKPTKKYEIIIKETAFFDCVKSKNADGRISYLLYLSDNAAPYVD